MDSFLWREFMIKAIFFDIDGTLISYQYPRMKKETIETLNRLKKDGIKLFIASGRHVLEVEELQLDKDFHFDGYLLLNGGYCFNDKDVIYENVIDAHDVKQICQVIKEYHLPTLFIEKDDMYVNFVNEKVIQAQESINTSIPKISQEIHYEAIMQIDPYVDDLLIKKIMKNTKNCKYTKWHDEAFDIIPSTGGKKAGIEAIKQYYGFQKEELVAFGDGENDIEMFHSVGISIAMNNAKDIVKEHADIICDDVDHRGITSGIEQLGLLSGLSK